MRHQSLPGKGKASKSSRPAGPLAPSGLSSKQQKRDLKRAAKAAAGGTELGNKRLKAAESPSPQVSNMISAYKRPNVYPESYFSSLASAVRKPGFLTPSDAMYPAVMTRCYKGAFVEDGSAYSLDFHDRFDAALRGLENNTNFLKFDITQPGGLGTKIAKTYVSRCVVGQPGITYKYLGLRLFAYPWTAGEEGATPETVEIGRLNDEMVRHTSQLLADRCDSSNPYYGSCQYNLTLINRCFPSGEIDLKMEPMFEKDSCTVSWHADSSLEHFSTIGVYHVSLDQEAEAALQPWRIALRVRHDSEGPGAGKFNHGGKAESDAARVGLVRSAEEEKHPEIVLTPPVAVPLPQRCCYYMFDDFNHHHQHSVLVGDTHRFASTHRVCKLDGHTYFNIQNRCKSVLKGSSCEVKQIRAEQLILNEIEFEWIRQYYVQGSQHLKANVWWSVPMQQLMMYWAQLEERTLSILQVLQEAALSILSFPEQDSGGCGFVSKKKASKIKKKAETIDLECYHVLIEYMKSREEKRSGWMKRSSEKLYGKCPRSEQPLVPPFSFCNGRNLQSVEDFKKEIIGSRNSVEYLKGSKEGISSPLPLQLSIYIDALLIFRDIFEQK